MPNVDEPVQDGELKNEVRAMSQRLDGIDKRLDVVDKRLDVVDHRLQAVEVGLAKVQAIEPVVSKGELHAALNAQTWKIMSSGLTIVAAAFALARYL